MKNQESNVARRTWRLLRLALLWTRKGGDLRDRIVTDLRLVPKYFKRLGHNTNNHGALYYGERQLSFDETPTIHFKMHRPSSLRFKMPHIPCIKPQLDFDYDFDYNRKDNKCYYIDSPKKSSSESISEDYEEEEYDDSVSETSEELHNDSIIDYRPTDVENDDGNEIDLKAEKFISTFYQQMKMQRQISYIQYNDMLNRGLN